MLDGLMVKFYSNIKIISKSNNKTHLIVKKTKHDYDESNK